MNSSHSVISYLSVGHKPVSMVLIHNKFTGAGENFYLKSKKFFVIYKVEIFANVSSFFATKKINIMGAILK